MSEKATGENYLAATFEGVPDVKAPSRTDWMKQAKDDHKTLTKAMSLLQYSSAELGEIIRKKDEFEEFGALMNSLLGMQESHSDLIGRLETLQTRLLVAIHQAYPDQARVEHITH